MQQRVYSFSTRLSLYIILVTGLVFVCSFLFFFTFAKRSVSNEAFAHAQSEIKSTSRAIETTLRQVEQAVNSSAILVQKTLPRPDSLCVILEAMVASNPIMVGASVAFEPYYYPKRGYYFMPYVCREGNTIKRKLLGSDTYDYHRMGWYAIPKQLKTNYWSEPYYDKGGGGTIMTTYTRLLTHSDGTMYGVVTADIALDEFRRLVESTKPYNNSYPFMLSRNGYYLSHRNKERILNETVFSATKEMTDTMVTHLGRQMMSGEKGVQELNNDDTLSYVFYAPIGRTDWSVASVVPHDEVFGELDSMIQSAVWVAIFGFAALFGFAVLVIRRVAAPLPLFSKSAQLIASGNFEVALPAISSRDELGELHDSFQFMQDSLKNYVIELKAATIEKQQIESELQIARTIQMGMVPKIFPPFPDRDDIDLYAVLHPAREVGGDLYDFFISNDKLYFVIGDVSGKGVPASLLMAVTRSLFRSVTAYTTNVKDIVENMNHSLSETNEANMFITLFVGILDLHSGHIDYCNAGHNPPVILAKDKQPLYMKTVVNIPIGIFDDYEYQSATYELREGDSIFLYTDGVTEAQNKQYEQYGEQALLDKLNISGKQTSKQTVISVVEAVVEFAQGEEPYDDITMLSIKYKASERKLTLKNELPGLAVITEAMKEQID